MLFIKQNAELKNIAFSVAVFPLYERKSVIADWYAEVGFANDKTDGEPVKIRTFTLRTVQCLLRGNHLSFYY